MILKFKKEDGTWVIFDNIKRICYKLLSDKEEILLSKDILNFTPEWIQKAAKEDRVLSVNKVEFGSEDHFLRILIDCYFDDIYFKRILLQTSDIFFLTDEGKVLEAF